MQFHMPVKLYFGAGLIKGLGDIVFGELKADSPVIMTDKGIVQAGLLDRVKEYLPGALVFDTIEAIAFGNSDVTAVHCISESEYRIILENALE